MFLCSDFRVTSGSVLGAALSLAVTTMGAGILTLPSAYADAGIIPTTLILTAVAILTAYSIDFLILSVEKMGRNSYEELAQELLGQRAVGIVRWMLILDSIGAAISYLIVVEDLAAPLQPLVMQYIPFLENTKHTLLFIWAIVILPLSCVPKLGALHFISFFAISATSLICGMIIFRYFVPGPTPPSAITVEAMANSTDRPRWWWGANPLLVMPIATFAFGCQTITFQIYAGLDDMRRSTMMRVSVMSMFITGLIHAAVGAFGYLSNPVDIRDNIISNYDPNIDYVFAVGYVIYTVPVILAFVLILFPVRDAFFFLWYGYSSASTATHVPRPRDYTQLVNQEEQLELIAKQEMSDVSMKEESIKLYGSLSGTLPAAIEEEMQHVVEAKKHHNDVETIPLRDHLLVSVALSTLCVAVALVVPGMISVVSFLGGFCGAPLFFFIPGLYRWQLHYKSIARCQTRLEWCIMVFMVAFGAVGMILGTGVSVYNVYVTRV